MTLSPENVKDILQKVFFTTEEVIQKVNKPENVVKGVRIICGFHPGRLTEATPNIIDLLSQLPSFFSDKGGSLLEMSYNKDDIDWTFDFRLVDAFLCLGIAIGKVTLNIPKEIDDDSDALVDYPAIHIKLD